MLDFDKQFENEMQTLIGKSHKIAMRSSKKYNLRAAFLAVYGFQMALPVLLGIFLGIFLDKIYPLEYVSWTLNFILLGFLIGLFNANFWFYRMMNVQRSHAPKKTNVQRKKFHAKTKGVRK